MIAVVNGVYYHQDDITMKRTKMTDEDVLILETKAEMEKQSKAFNDAILINLDAKCVGLGFSGDDKTRPYRAIANYVGFENVFRADAEKLGAWIANTFSVAEQIEKDVINGIRPLPTIDEVIAELPKYE